jgi:SAM-dependent methyltransferase
VAVSFHDHFSGHAAQYAAHRPAWPVELVDALAAVSHGHERAWDVGCGSGQLSTLLPARFREVIATDASAAQLEHARPAPGVTYRCARAGASGLDAQSVDCVVVAQAAHWFDLPAFVAECRRVGRPGAPVVLVTYGLMLLRDDLDVLIDDFALNTLARFWPPERRHVDDGYASLDFPLAAVPFPAVTMRARWSVEQTLGYVETWSAVAAAKKAGAGARFTDFASSLRQTWSDGSLLDVQWPLAVRAGRLE